MHRFVLLLVAAFAGAALGQQCPDDWKTFQHKCYAYGKGQVTFGDALTICHHQGAKLVEITSAIEDHFLADLSRQHDANSVWIGATNILGGPYKWVSTQKNLKLGYTNWGAGQPDNYGNVENCATLFRPINYMWNDNTCSKTFNFICERPLYPQHASESTSSNNRDDL